MLIVFSIMTHYYSYLDINTVLSIMTHHYSYLDINTVFSIMTHHYSYLDINSLLYYDSPSDSSGSPVNPSASKM